MSTSAYEPPVATGARHRVVRVRTRSAAALAIASTTGLLAFCWPLLVRSDSLLAQSSTAPLVLALLLPLLVAVVLAELADNGMDAKSVALLGVLAAVGAALRPLGTGVAGFEPVFFLLVLAGRALGRGFGFVLGALTLFASALLTGGVGPWLPYQMLGAAWVGFLAGCLPPARGRREVLLVAGYGAVAGLVYGFLLDLSFWPYATGLGSSVSYVAGAGLGPNLGRFLAFWVTTSLGFDIPRALLTGALVVAAGPAVLLALRRAARRAAFDAPVEFDTPS